MDRIVLTGHSGCRVELMQEARGAAFVRKTSASASYNDRLRGQCRKQQQSVARHIRAPLVLAEGIDDHGLFYFEMEYIQGTTLAKAMSVIEVSRIRSLVEEVMSDCTNRAAMHPLLTTKKPQDFFLDKIELVTRQTSGLKNALLGAALIRLQRHDWSGFEASRCHGDLTLQNLLVGNTALYAIDFLDSFYDCWILDVSKLMQDVELMWSYRADKSIDSNTALRLMVFRDKLLESVSAIGGASLVSDVYFGLLLCLVRIYPYAMDSATMAFLDAKLADVMRAIDDRVRR